MDFNQKSFDIVYRLTEEHSGMEAARARTGIVTFNYHRQQVIQVPESVKENLSR